MTTPYGSTTRSDHSQWTTASTSSSRTPSSRNSTSQAVSLRQPLTLSSLRQKILTEDEYSDAISAIIKRDFFGSLCEYEEQTNLIRAFENKDMTAVSESMQRMRDIVTPRVKSRTATPGRTPYGTEPSHTPTYFGDTPTLDTPNSRKRKPEIEPELYDSTLSLDQFQARYTSEDNSAFAELLKSDNTERRKKYSWAWDAEKKANQKAIRGREARERLVDVTREMIAKDPNGEVRMVEGGAGRPGERMLVVEGVKFNTSGERLMVTGTQSAERLLIGNGEFTGVIDRKGKGKMVDYIDHEKEDEDAIPIGDPLLKDRQVPVDTWGFTNRNSFMFPPDADVPFDRDAILESKTEAEQQGLPPGSPKSIRYHATRLDERVSSSSKSSTSGFPSPTRSRINAAITGTPYHAAASATPRVAGFSFVDALPTPRASSLSAQSLSDLMSWGKIESTPIALSSAASKSRSILGQGGGPFHLKAQSNREALAHKLARKAQKSLGDRAIGSNSRGEGGIRSSTRSLQASILDPFRTASPRAARNELSPAAQKLLGKTLVGKTSSLGRALESKSRLERANISAREVESRDKLKRSKWSPSPAPSMGFDPDLED